MPFTHICKLIYSHIRLYCLGVQQTQLIVVVTVPPPPPSSSTTSISHSLAPCLYNIVAHYGLRFWHGWAVLICSWQQIFYHVAFAVIFFWCATQYITRKSNYASYAISKCLLFSRPMSWCFDLLKYYLLLFLLCRLPSNWVVQMEYTMDWDTPNVYTAYSISLECARVWACFFPPSLSRLARLLTRCVRSINKMYQMKYK